MVAVVDAFADIESGDKRWGEEGRTGGEKMGMWMQSAMVAASAGYVGLMSR